MIINIILRNIATLLIQKLTIKENTNNRKRANNMTKYKVSLSVDKNWIDRFDLTFEADSEHEAESMAMIEVKQNLSDYITAYADDESEE